MFFSKLITFVMLVMMATFGSTEKCCKNYNYTYQVSNDEQNWYQALINCESAGMKLATINSREDNENLEKYVSQNANIGVSYWLGATNLGNTNWYWATTGQPVVYTSWKPNQPDNTGNLEHCLHGVSLNGIFQWNDINCNNKYLYICEKEPCCVQEKGNSACWCHDEEESNIDDN